MSFVLERPNSAAFDNLLTSDYIFRSVPEDSAIDADLELIKGAAARLALTIFDASNKDFRFSPNATFGSVFSQDIYGAGFPKGLSTIFAYLICLDENDRNLDWKSVAVVKFAGKVREIANEVFIQISKDNRELSGVRKLAEELDNYGGYYQRTPLATERDKQIVPEGVLKCVLEIDQSLSSGHLIAKIDLDLAKKFLKNYRPEIESYLTEEGKKHLQLPENLGIVIVIYKDEFKKVSQEKLTNLLGKQIELSFKTPYFVPARGDYRCVAAAAFLMESVDIKNIRQELGLQELYSEGRPLRYTFGIVRNQYVEEESLLPRMTQSQSLKPWMQFINQRTEKKV